MTDGAVGFAWFSVITICVTFLVWDARRRKTPKHDIRFDRVNAILQREAVERGKIARRLAQAETKIARLQKQSSPVVGGLPVRMEQNQK
jgi:Flp pilus assembly protein TadB